MECYRRRQMSETVTNLPPTLCVGGSVIILLWNGTARCYFNVIRHRSNYLADVRLVSSLTEKRVRGHETMRSRQAPRDK